MADIISSTSHRFILDAAEKDALQKHIYAFEEKRDSGGFEREREREVANLALFFCGKEGSGVNGALIGADGCVVEL